MSIPSSINDSPINDYFPELKNIPDEGEIKYSQQEGFYSDSIKPTGYLQGTKALLARLLSRESASQFKAANEEIANRISDQYGEEAGKIFRQKFTSRISLAKPITVQELKAITESLENLPSSSTIIKTDAYIISEQNPIIPEADAYVIDGQNPIIPEADAYVIPEENPIISNATTEVDSGPTAKTPSETFDQRFDSGASEPITSQKRESIEQPLKTSVDFGDKETKIDSIDKELQRLQTPGVHVGYRSWLLSKALSPFFSYNKQNTDVFNHSGTKSLKGRLLDMTQDLQRNDVEKQVMKLIRQKLGERSNDPTRVNTEFTKWRVGKEERSQRITVKVSRMTSNSNRQQMSEQDQEAQLKARQLADKLADFEDSDPIHLPQQPIWNDLSQSPTPTQVQDQESESAMGG